MIKVTYSSDINSTVGVGGEIVKSASELGKQASTIFHMEYEQLKPPEGMTGIHLVALGDAEAYGMNRNGDLFSKEACVKYHDTFVKHGHVYEHHRNKDPRKALGQIKAAAYNPDMHRIELYIWADNEKSHDHLERLEKTGEVSFSMACVRAGTPIATTSGMRPIEKVSVGDIVLTHAGNWKRVSAVMERDVEEYCEVSFVSWGNRVLEITPNHNVYAVSFDDIPRRYRADHAEHPNKAWCRRHRSVLPNYLRWIPAAELTSEHYMCVPMWDDRPEAVGVKMARILGYYIAEGSVTSNFVQITCNKEDCFVDEVKQFDRWSSVATKTHRGSDKCIVMNCYGAAIQKEIIASCGRRCENKHIPESVRMGSIEEKMNFAAAWFNGDGWQDKDGLHWSIHNSNLANDLQMLLASVGISSSCTRIMHKEDRGIVKSKNPVEFVVTVSNDNSALFSDISKAKELTIDGSSKQRAFISGRYMFVPVSGVKTVKRATKVYNISVEDDESYTVFGLAVHNCKVPYDRCSICGAIRKQAGDKDECDHIKYQLGKVAEDGRQIGTYNDEPTWFDISFVGRPADRIAWNLKVASAMPEELSINSSVKQAEVEGYVLPDDLAIESPSAMRKQALMKDLAAMHDQMNAWLFKSASPSTKSERYRFELRKVAGASLPDDVIGDLRAYDPSAAFAAMADAGVVMDVPSFFKYAFGPDYHKVEKYVPEVEKALPGVIDKAVKEASCARFCNETRFDAAEQGDIARQAVSRGLRDRLAKCAAARCFGLDDGVTGVLEAIATGSEPVFQAETEKTASATVDETGANGVSFNASAKLAEKYAMYKLAGIDAILNGTWGASLDRDDVVAVFAAQDLKRTQTGSTK